ncbi:AarF/ABC1/UbiB kinase family protein [Thiorhodococcus mannitoliphagus]|uniref:AarF/ABC1/UbiB kinase family protein n=1 Tax=Thiorhodococcus mannitoliphagus TaxID=329406 RepID=A0A6P1DWM6_9GAMM|nr:AarF/ABC1/UbiB kinase family protein [Thiorhodococcus mannitoliphagus]NEX21850.1 AarF/ABC1/UbiB kinase family protein [Thiorhodococcus mannitoliphagus]
MTQAPLTGGRAVPSSRLNRLWHLGRATTDLAAGIGMRGLIDLARGNEGASDRVQLSPEAFQRITNRLSHMRGAMMKMGQLMSMDGSDVLTPEAAAILGALCNRAEPMPLSQLAPLLESEYGKDWNRRFRRFAFTPVAAASIGQVHRAETADGRHLALKIQFPGVRESIDSDMDNLGFLSRAIGMSAKGMDLKPMLEEARRQLHQEADYEAEANALETYRGLIGDGTHYFVPEVHRDFSTGRILAMDFADGIAIDQLAEASFTRDDRDRAANLVMEIVLRELFEFRLVQTDPNFGNFLYQADSGRVVLLDFGATHPVPPAIVSGYRDLIRAAMVEDREAMYQSAIALGFAREDTERPQVDGMLELMRLSSEMMRHQGPYDFGASDLFKRIYDQGQQLYYEGAYSQLPDPSSVFLYRKFLGAFLLCRRLRARVDLPRLLEPYL